jgi:Fe2+ transport system protein B
MNFLKGDIDHLGETLNATVEKGAAELQKGLDKNIKSASLELSANIEKIADRLDQTVLNVEASVKSAVEDASSALGQNIKNLSEEVNKHRNLTKDDITKLIDYACEKFDATIDRRLQETTARISTLVDEKVTTMRKNLSEAALEQKRTFIRNTLVALGSAIGIALISLAAKRFLNTPFDILSVFRIVLGALAAGGIISLGYRVFIRYQKQNQTKRDITTVLLGDAGIFSPKGLLFHLIFLLLGAILWLILALRPEWLGIQVG